MSFLRHVGRVGDRKVAIVFREVPDEPHMCLLVYTETLHSHIHDDLMRCIESDIGQSSESLADALNRTPGTDGKPLLQSLHFNGSLKKMQSENVIVTPNPSTKIRLDELNKILNEMQQGESAVKRLAELDASRGLQDPADIAKRMRGETPAVDRASAAAPAAPLKAAGDTALSDSDIANNLRSQAQQMEAQAQNMLAEARRLSAEADGLSPPAKPEKAKRSRTRATA